MSPPPPPPASSASITTSVYTTTGDDKPAVSVTRLLRPVFDRLTSSSNPDPRTSTTFGRPSTTIPSSSFRSTLPPMQVPPMNHSTSSSSFNNPAFTDLPPPIVRPGRANSFSYPSSFSARPSPPIEYRRIDPPGNYGNKVSLTNRERETATSRLVHTGITRPASEAEWFTRIPNPPATLGRGQKPASSSSGGGGGGSRPKSYSISSTAPSAFNGSSSVTAVPRAPNPSRPWPSNSPWSTSIDRGVQAPVARQVALRTNGFHEMPPPSKPSSSAVARPPSVPSVQREIRQPPPPPPPAAAVPPIGRLTRSRSISEPHDQLPYGRPPRPPTNRVPGAPVVVSTTLWEDELTIVMSIVVDGNLVARRCDNDWINCTKLLNLACMTRGKRDMFLKHEPGRIVFRRGALHLKGVWLPLPSAIRLASSFGLVEQLFPLFEPNLTSWLFSPTNRDRTEQLVRACRGRDILKSGTAGRGGGPNDQGSDDGENDNEREVNVVADEADREARREKLCIFIGELGRRLEQTSGIPQFPPREERIPLEGAKEGDNIDQEMAPKVAPSSSDSKNDNLQPTVRLIEISAYSSSSGGRRQSISSKSTPSTSSHKVSSTTGRSTDPPYFGRVSALASPHNSHLASYSLKSSSPTIPRPSLPSMITLPDSPRNDLPSFRFEIESTDPSSSSSWFNNRTPPPVNMVDYVSDRVEVASKDNVEEESGSGQGRPLTSKRNWSAANAMQGLSSVRLNSSVEDDSRSGRSGSAPPTHHRLKLDDAIGSSSATSSPPQLRRSRSLNLSLRSTLTPLQERALIKLAESTKTASSDDVDLRQDQNESSDDTSSEEIALETYTSTQTEIKTTKTRSRTNEVDSDPDVKRRRVDSKERTKMTKDDHRENNE